jgi:hypothetical protein
MENNVFYKNLTGIVKESYGGRETPKLDWQTAIDVYNARENITAGMASEEIAKQRSAFLSFVAGKRFLPNATVDTKKKGELRA